MDELFWNHEEQNIWFNTRLFGCISLSTVLAVPEIQPVEKRVFPNPAGNLIHVRDLEAGSSISIYSQSGIKVLNIERVNPEITIDISTLTDGIYTAVINGKEIVRFIRE